MILSSVSRIVGVLALVATVSSPALFAQSDVTVSVTSPAAGEVLDAGIPYEIRWTSSRDVYEWFVWGSADGGTTWTRVWECMYLTPGARSCRWESPWPVSSRVRVRVVADDDGEAYAAAESGIFAIADRGAGGLPPGWTNGDIGRVAAAGDALLNGGTFTLHGSGADIWGTADEFHFAGRPAVEDEETATVVTARVTSVQPVDRWTKAGLMIRNGLVPGAQHASLFATPTVEKGIAFQRRPAADGASVHTAGPALAPPVWLKLTQRGTVVTAHYRKEATDAWTRIGEQTLAGLTSSFDVRYGLAVSSHADGRLATATFDHVTIGGRPVAWTSEDIGAVGASGASRDDGLTLTAQGAGADIWGTADAFRFVHYPMYGGDSLTARVQSLSNTHAWAKAGVMLRANTSPGSPHVMVIVSPGKGIAMQYRRTQDGASESLPPVPGGAPAWVRLTHDGSAYVGWMSRDGITWREVGRVALPFLFESTRGGLAVTSHRDPSVATAVFDDIHVGRTQR